MSKCHLNKFLLAFAAFGFMGPARATIPPAPERIRLVAHRGESIEAPENSLEAFRRVFSDGCSAECDLYLSRDGVVFLTHNWNAKKMMEFSGIDKPPTNCFWKGELDRAEAALNRGKAWKGTPFARFDDMLALAPSNVLLYLDVKDPRREILPKIREAIDRHPQVSDENLVFLGKFDRTLFPKSKNYRCRLSRRSWKDGSDPVPREEILAELRKSERDGLSVRWDREIVTADYVKFFADAGYPVNVWSVNEPEEVALAFSRGVATVTTDSPRRILTLWNEAFTPPPAKEEGAYRMMVFNIWGPFFGNPVGEREEGVVETVRRENPDVVAFQECTPEWWAGGLLAKLSDTYGIVEGGWERANRHHNPNPLLYRTNLLEVVASGRELFHHQLDYSKGYTWAIFRDRKTGRAFTAFSTHFWWQENGRESDQIRLTNAEKLLAGLDRIRHIAPTPVIGGGDFNAKLGSLALDYLFDRGFADAQQMAPEASQETSWHDYPVRDWRGRYRGFLPRAKTAADQSLDHVIATRGVEFIRHRLDRHPTAMDVSDHSPVVVDFRLK